MCLILNPLLDWQLFCFSLLLFCVTLCLVISSHRFVSLFAFVLCLFAAILLFCAAVRRPFVFIFCLVHFSVVIFCLFKVVLWLFIAESHLFEVGL